LLFFLSLHPSPADISKHFCPHHTAIIGLCENILLIVSGAAMGQSTAGSIPDDATVATFPFPDESCSGDESNAEHQPRPNAALEKVAVRQNPPPQASRPCVLHVLRTKAY
jgi:hypothetical protein